mmetsp:Transcript_2974/g.5794  ORF Transcript_2974/g.5794 Transcript_2974/m.5794 type:complete len:89 (+) Transcript_2974:96-362(+)
MREKSGRVCEAAVQWSAGQGKTPFYFDMARSHLQSYSVPFSFFASSSFLSSSHLIQLAPFVEVEEGREKNRAQNKHALRKSVCFTSCG